MHTSFTGRVGAVLVALALTGAPALAARSEPGEHRCLCKAHARDHECECARCHGATRQGQAADAKVPPCHGAAAKDGEHARRRGVSDAPCMTGTCGAPEQLLASLTPLESFTLPLAAAPGGVLPPAGSPAGGSQAQPEAPAVPATPPPRGDRPPAPRV